MSDTLELVGGAVKTGFMANLVNLLKKNWMVLAGFVAVVVGYVIYRRGGVCNACPVGCQMESNSDSEKELQTMNTMNDVNQEANDPISSTSEELMQEA